MPVTRFAHVAVAHDDSCSIVTMVCWQAHQACGHIATELDDKMISQNRLQCNLVPVDRVRAPYKHAM